ncbi:MAG: glycosyltransferase family 9 protein [Nitrospinae bacterium]|nr:glycosyltransferase family 9 protein [Nitrospinota bacterium]
MNFRTMKRGIKNLVWEAVLLIHKLRKGIFPKRDLLHGIKILDIRKTKKILIIRHDRIGDTILATPVIKSLKKSLPDVEIFMVIGSGGYEVVKENPYIKKAFIYDKKGFVTSPIKLLRFIIGLRQEEIDLSLTLSHSFTVTGSLISFLSKARYRVGYRDRYSSIFYNIDIPKDGMLRHEIENNLLLIESLGIKDVIKRPDIFVSTSEESIIQGFLIKNRRYPDIPLISIKPGSRLKGLGWDISNYVEICKRLTENRVGEVILIFGPGEDDLHNHMMRLVKERPIIVLRSPNIRELTVVIDRSDLLICNHTGIMHITSAVKTPVIAIFKHGEPGRWGPFEVPSRILEDRDDRPLSSDTVYNEVVSFLKYSITEENSYRFSDNKLHNDQAICNDYYLQ